MKTLLLALTLIWVSLCALQNVAKGAQLPDLWKSVRSSSYHIQYQLEMSGTAELINVEEWASFDEHLFRLDLISSSGRTSYLTNGNTGEMFRYKAFTCEPITEDLVEFKVFAELFLGHPIRDHDFIPGHGPMLAYGLGPLWLKARNKALSVNFRPAKKLGSENKQTLFAELDQYVVEMPLSYSSDPGKQFTLRFLFPTGADHFVEIVEWIASDIIGSKVAVTARARLVNLDLNPLDQAYVFDLPVGYGCTRAERINQQVPVDVSLSLLHEGFPNQISLAISTSRPNDDILSASSSWSVHKYTATLMRHSMPLPVSLKEPRDDSESYFVSLMQERDERSGRLKRSKRIWWLPTNKVNDKTQALVYEFDMSASDDNSCQMRHRNIKDQLVLSFPGVQNSPFSGENNKRMVLSLDQILFLFQDSSNYHLISNTEQSDKRQARFKSLYYEKRLEHFELSYEGSLVWSGPVSIVKQVNSHSQSLNQISEKMSSESAGNSDQSKILQLPVNYKTTLSLFFYSKDLQNILFKAVIELLENHEVDLDYLHKQLDVSACFPVDKQKSLLVKYPIEDPSMTKQVQLQQEHIRAQMFQNLFDRTVFFPLQMANLQTSLDYFNLQLRMTLLDLPLTHTFKLEKGLVLIKDKHDNSSESRNSLHKSIASTAEKCAQICEQYNCFRFSYGSNSGECYIELISGKAKLLEEPSCDLYSYVKRSDPLYWRPSRLANEVSESSRARLSPRSVVEMFEQMLMSHQSGGDLEGFNPLNVKLHINELEGNHHNKDERTEVVLRPVSIESDFESMNEYQEPSQHKPFDGSIDGEHPDDGPLNRLQYALMLEDIAFKEDVGQTLHGIGSYEDCASYCEDNDCRSFSFCKHDEVCTITDLHNEKSVSRYAKPSSYVSLCNIYSLDYLSKFESFGKMILPAKVRSSSDGSSPADCANICMDEQGFACQGFYFCRIPDESLIGEVSDPTKCYLIDQHVQDPLTDKDQLQAMPNQETSGLPGTDCSFYSRSYLAQFEKFYHKKIAASNLPTTGGHTLVVAGSDIEHCARRCIEGSCLAFDICPITDNSFTWQQCRFAFKTISGGRQIEAEPKCTTFTLSDKSQFNKRSQKFIENSKPDQLAPIEQSKSESTSALVVDENAKTLIKEDINAALLDQLDLKRIDKGPGSSGSGSSGWHSLWRMSWSLALGVSVGSISAVLWNEAYARGWLDQLGNRFAAFR